MHDRFSLTWTMIRSPFQRHHMLISHVPVGIEKVALYQVIVFPTLLLQPGLVLRGRADEEEERHVRRPLAPGLPDHVPLWEVLGRGVDQHQQQQLRTVARVMVDREAKVLDVDQGGFVTERELVQRVRLRGWRRVPGEYEQVSGARDAVAVRRQGA